MSQLTHIDEKGAAIMVNVGEKARTKRVAVAFARVNMKEETAALIRSGEAKKGDVLACARIAGIMAAKRTAELIPLCHNLPLDSVTVDFRLTGAAVEITAEAKCTYKTGVEMEAMTAASVAALTIYDMVKGVDRGVVISDVMLLEKDGGKSGRYTREQP